MANNYQPSYMQDDEEDGQESAQNPIQSQQNQLQGTTAPGSTGQGAQPPGAPAAGSTSAESANVTSPSANAATPGIAAAQTKRSSGQFTNLQKFIGANKDTDLAGKIQSNVQEQTGAARNTLTQRAGEVGQALASQKQQREQLFGQQQERQPNQVAGAAGQALTQAGAKGQQEQATQAPDLAQQEQTLTQARDYSYKGPADIETSDLERKRQDLSAIGKSTGSEAGRFGLLQQMFGKPSYSSGQQKLDNLLLQNQEGAKEKLAGVRQDTRALSSELDKTSSATRANIKQEQVDAKTDVDSFAAQMGTTSEALTNDLQGRIGQMNEELAADFAEFTPEEKASIMKQVGFNQKANGEFVVGDLSSVGIDELKNIFEQVKTDASLSNFDADALARANMLQRLRGQSELGQFDAEAGPFGVSKDIAEGYEGIKEYAPKAGASLAAPKMLSDVAQHNRNVGQKFSAAQLDNMIYDSKDQRKGVFSAMNTGTKADKAIQDSAMFKVLSPADRAKVMSEVNRITATPQVPNQTTGAKYSSAVSLLSDLAAKQAQATKGIVTKENKAQKQALTEMAKYLRDSSSDNREAFEQDWSPKTYGGKETYLSNNPFGKRAQLWE